ncbi:MAG: CU044_2847 family protein [Pseudonocardiaceae bacterium]
MGELKMAVPLADGSEVLVAVDHGDVPDDLVLAAADPQKVAARASETLEQLLEKVTPTVRSVSEWVRAHSPDECGVEFGLKLGGETGVIVAKGTAEVNFVVKLTWRKP